MKRWATNRIGLLVVGSLMVVGGCFCLWWLGDVARNASLPNLGPEWGNYFLTFAQDTALRTALSLVIICVGIAFVFWSIVHWRGNAVLLLLHSLLEQDTERDPEQQD